MARLVWKCALFAALNAALAVALLKAHELTLQRERWETDSILLVMPQDSHKDLVFLGTSHAYVFSRFKEHHEATERVLGRSVFNMAIPQGGGIVPARFYLESFWEAGNTTDRVVYFIDPFVFYTAGSSEDHKFVYFEPFRFRFMAKLIRNGYKYQQLISYVRSKLSAAWLLQKPEPLIHHTRGYPPELVTPERIEHRIGTLYPDGMSDEILLHYQREFMKIVADCKATNTPLSVVIPPTLLGPEWGHKPVLAWLQTLQDAGDLDVHDWADVMHDDTKYYNIDHMNLSGIEQFMGDYVRPMLDALNSEG